MFEYIVCNRNEFGDWQAIFRVPASGLYPLERGEQRPVSFKINNIGKYPVVMEGWGVCEGGKIVAFGELPEPINLPREYATIEGVLKIVENPALPDHVCQMDVVPPKKRFWDRLKWGFLR